MDYLGLMDNGAHYFACDFQVHSPRDRDWIGSCPSSEHERLAYAANFIGACRTKKLDAIAITDHHDVVFVEYIRTAAQRELDGNGTPVPLNKQIVVFPGIELTLATPCQAILLFDPDCAATELNAALTILGITPSPAADLKTCETKRLDPALTLGEICERLSNNDKLKGRFLLLPNVNDGGDDSLLRSGFFQHYIDMPCVGGYVDGSFIGHKKNLIVSGKDTQWGSKKIGVFQTSDNREADFAKLGKHRTWVKWSYPSAEALRQACLAPSSRLAYTEPSLPKSWIKSMSVSDSQYFGPFKVEFNAQTNMAIGGRGSGKSTLLEYLRWGLCDQPVSINEDGSEEVPNYEKRRGSLIRSTLQKSHGSVTIEYIISGVSHLIRRDAVSEKVFLTIEGESEKEVAQAVIQGLARVQGYSQKQLSNVSVRSSELLRLVTSPIKVELDLLTAAEQESASKLRSCFQNKIVQKALTAQRAATLTELTSKRSQVDALNAGMGD
jgi:chromosome segregation protein